MGDTFDYLASFAQFPVNLHGFLRKTITVDDAKRIVRERLERREENFLHMARQSIYNNAQSPYLALLKMAGCEFNDLSSLVKQKGLEAALTQLRDAGVYVTFEEFKGRKPIVRHGKSIPVTSRDFDNRSVRQDFVTETGGSSGRGIYVSQNLVHIAAGVPSHLLMLAAHNVVDVPAAVWGQILPGSGMHFILTRLHGRQPVSRWFSGIGWREAKSWPKYSAGTLYMLFWLRLYGVRDLYPIVTHSDHALRVAQWLHSTVRQHGKALLYSNVSQSLRASIAAVEAGLDLSGVTLRTGGEPVTAAKAETITRSGMRIMSSYGAIETGGIGMACANASNASDVHLGSDSFGLITFPREIEGAGVIVPAFNLTTLRPSAPKVMLNYESDDYGIVETHSCGCGLEACGYTTHIRDIRSYSKLLAEGMTLIGNEMLTILNDVLPARFGGTLMDYQLQEAEDENGFTRLYLAISPHLDIQNESDVVNVILDGLGQSSATGDVARLTWQKAGTIRIKRTNPIATARGKLLPLYIQRNDNTNK